MKPIYFESSYLKTTKQMKITLTTASYPKKYDCVAKLEIPAGLGKRSDQKNILKRDMDILYNIKLMKEQKID